MRWAAAEKCIIVTHDLDFGDLLAYVGATSPSVIIIRSDDTANETILPPLLMVLQENEYALRAGCLISMTTTSARVRSLPIK